jgi:hypothetical protein
VNALLLTLAVVMDGSVALALSSLGRRLLDRDESLRGVGLRGSAEIEAMITDGDRQSQPRCL